MKQKNFDAEQLYKEHITNISADQTAIGRILSEERQPTYAGARIKHSTGKLATLTAAAAVVALCAGIGLSNLNENDVESRSAASKPETTVVTTADQTKQNSTVTPAKQEDNFKTEITESYASDHSLSLIVKMTALNDNGKDFLKNAETYDIGFMQSSELKDNGFHLISSTECVIDGNTLTARLCFIAGHGNDVLNDGEKIEVSLLKQGENEAPADRKFDFTVKKNNTERVFKSANGKTLWLSDYHFNCDMDSKAMDKQTFANFEMTFADGTVKTPFNMQCIANGSTKPTDGGSPNIYFGFKDKIDSSKVTSIKYAGETFTPYEQAAVTMTCKPIAVSERAFGIEIKLTAGNEEGKKVLKENAEKISSSLKVEKDGMIVTAGSFFGADKLSGDSLTLRLFGDIFNKRIDTVPITIKLDSETPQAVIDALGSNSSETIYFKKTVEDKEFVSKSGEHFWLSDYFATTDHNPTAPKLPFVILKLKDGTEVSTKDIGLTEGGNHGNGKINKQFTYVFDGKFQKGIDNVVSISYDGVTFTAQ